MGLSRTWDPRPALQVVAAPRMQGPNLNLLVLFGGKEGMEKTTEVTMPLRFLGLRIWNKGMAKSMAAMMLLGAMV